MYIYPLLMFTANRYIVPKPKKVSAMQQISRTFVPRTSMSIGRTSHLAPRNNDSNLSPLSSKQHFLHAASSISHVAAVLQLAGRHAAGGLQGYLLLYSANTCRAGRPLLLAATARRTVFCGRRHLCFHFG